MLPPNIENSIIKYFAQSADVDDLDLLNNWLKDENNQKVFKEYVKTNFAITIAMHDPNLDKIKDELLKQIKIDSKPVYRVRFNEYLKYAAIAIVFLALGFLLKKDVFVSVEEPVVVPRENAITLKLGNGQVRVLAEKDSSQVIDKNGTVVGHQKGNEITYEEKGYPAIEKNTLSVPNGKKFSITLSDGTKVHLNAGSSLTYPTGFQSSENRKVDLIGEAFFEVAHDSSRKFMVNSQELSVSVYGTRFNVSNYPEDEKYEVVLVDGSVSVASTDSTNANNGLEEFLEPGFMATIEKSDNAYQSRKVNTELYTSWMQGNLVFRDETFENIIRKLERHYNVVVINNNTSISKETFNATVETEYETIEQVFTYFKKVYDVDFTIIENKIIINQN
ncbi:FecR family protein [Euzebyella marina]|uniref:FecR family protein n=1 Tax=Euzebyella marina TaxID=1761453 RepID=A0A3G2L338_9FLAO|nr:FecR family protein [Euzebyella marina]AYN66697.1 FecR family protein [Euzebyella marina]